MERRLPSSPSSAITPIELDFAAILLAAAAAMLVTAQSPRAIPRKFSVTTPRTSAMSWVLWPPSGAHHVRCLLRLFGGILFASGLNVDKVVATRSKASAGTKPSPPPPPQAYSRLGCNRFLPSPELLSQIFSALRGEQHFAPQIPLPIGRLVPGVTSGSASAGRTI